EAGAEDTAAGAAAAQAAADAAAAAAQAAQDASAAAAEAADLAAEAVAAAAADDMEDDMPAGAPRRGGISKTSWVDSLFTGWDPHSSLSGGDNLGFLNYVYDRVLGFNDDASWKGELAETVEIPDDLTYIFHMRPGAIFQDGAPVDAHAMQANMERVQATSDAAGGTRNADGIARAVSMGAVDDTSWRMETSEPFGPTLAAFQAFPGTGMLISPDKFDIALTDPVGAGAAKYVSYAEDDRFVAERWDGYWDNDNVWVDGMERIVVPDMNTSWTAFLDGEFTLAQPPPAAVTGELTAQLEADGYAVAAGPDQTWTWNCYNLNQAAEGFNQFRDTRLRRAVHLIIDRQAVIDVAFRGLGEPSRGPTSNTSWALTKDYYSDSPNLDEARQLIDAAGYSDGIEGVQLSWSLDIHRAQTEVVHAQLAAMGINMEFVHGSETVIIDRWLGAADWSLGTLTWESPFDPDPVLRQFLGVLGGIHLGGATPEDSPNDELVQGLAETQALVDKAASVATQAERIPLYDECFQVYQEWGWQHHVLQRPKAMVAQSYVEDFRLVPFFAFPDGMGFKKIWFNNV
ncbi:MAG: ABC transporter substrate-binding protein, partial [Chloroflexi bacterium]|nr:ABC transporter substrate-binding protein [Chloroflexota bacterium]